jgi:hypothetical protein
MSKKPIVRFGMGFRLPRTSCQELFIDSNEIINRRWAEAHFEFDFLQLRRIAVALDNLSQVCHGTHRVL